MSIQAGLRYDFVTDPKELNDKVAGLLSLDDLNTRPDGITPGTPMFKNPSKKSFAPRVGAAWNPAGDKKSTIKAGYGLFYQPLTTSFYRGTTFRIYPYFAGVDIRQPTVFGPGMIPVLAAGVSPALVQKRSEFIFYDEKQPYMEQWHANYERDIGHQHGCRNRLPGVEGTQPAVLRRSQYDARGVWRGRREAAGTGRQAPVSELGTHPHAYQRSAVDLPGPDRQLEQALLEQLAGTGVVHVSATPGTRGRAAKSAGPISTMARGAPPTGGTPRPSTAHRATTSDTRSC